MKRRQRGKHGFWNNEEPLNDLHEALFLLEGESWHDYNKRYLSTEENELKICVDWYHEADSGGDTSGTYYFEITPELKKKLEDGKFITSRKVKSWGETRIEPQRFVLSEEGRQQLQELDKGERRAARELLIPGVHSQWSGLFFFQRYGRERNRFGGRLYFEFKTPTGENFRVFPQSKGVVVLEPDKRP